MFYLYKWFIVDFMWILFYLLSITSYHIESYTKVDCSQSHLYMTWGNKKHKSCNKGSVGQLALNIKFFFTLKNFWYSCIATGFYSIAQNPILDSIESARRETFVAKPEGTLNLKEDHDFKSSFQILFKFLLKAWNVFEALNERWFCNRINDFLFHSANVLVKNSNLKHKYHLRINCN